MSDTSPFAVACARAGNMQTKKLDSYMASTNADGYSLSDLPLKDLGTTRVKAVSAGILVLLYVTTTLLLLASTNMAPKGQFIIGTAINAGGGRMSLDICLAGEEVAFQRSPSPEAAAMKVPDARQVGK